jgi:hypothetical protein
MRLSIQPSFSTFYAGGICSLCPFPSNPAFSMLQCFPVSVSRSVSYAMRANFMFPNLSGGLGAVCRKLDMGMLAERPGGFPPNNRRLLSSRTMSAKPHVSVANACSTSRCLPLRPRLAPGALPGAGLMRRRLLGRRKRAQFGIDYDAAASPAMSATFRVCILN